ncbi:uncharacterized protein LOC123720617 [Pieris brassicae]|uniref:Leucine-rich repeat-containing protein 71 n=1 Tax=Pieris brassicae TaxID=7116 RepID=A0A9P0TTN3_PIEBR|nr:uncharacterized protein LOC123720617 [Pieris brassicae]CAH4037614.1 unnamed protein product [Pieris brassicae]
MSEDIRCSPLDLVNFLPYACYQLEAPFSVVVSTRILEEYVGDKTKKTKGEKSTVNLGSQAQVSTTEKKETPVKLRNSGNKDTVLVTVVLDTQGRIIELELINTILPIYFLKILELCIPFHPHIYTITLQLCPVSDKTIYELSSILSKSQVTELCLDKSPLAHCNCAAVLQHQTYLTNLSLNGCDLTDEDCEAIAVLLKHRRPPCHLKLLSLAFNLINDRGAVALGSMLRSNRHLRYLNLAKNQVTDTGALAIFNSLLQFPMTQDEIYCKRLHNFEYLKLYRNVYAKFYLEAVASNNVKVLDDRSGGRKKVTGKRSNASLAVNQMPNVVEIVSAATAATLDSIGTNDNPFNETLYEDGQVHSVGNTSLAYINISHNNISVISVLKLIEVLRYQDHLRGGLVRVTVEGNPLPSISPALLQLAELQHRAVARAGLAGVSKTDRKNTRKR